MGSALPLEAQPRLREHARFMDGLVADGFLLLGGPLADEGVSSTSSRPPRRRRSGARLAPTRGTGTHLVVRSVDRWTLRLDFRDEG